MVEQEAGKAIVLNERDNVATAVKDLAPGMRFAQVGRDAVQVAEPISSGHKFALTAILTGLPIVKYGETIGVATNDIFPGQWVHVHNVAGQRGRGDLADR